jgi:hypothetical protein
VELPKNYLFNCSVDILNSFLLFRHLLRVGLLLEEECNLIDISRVEDRCMDWVSTIAIDVPIEGLRCERCFRRQ